MSVSPFYVMINLGQWALTLEGELWLHVSLSSRASFRAITTFPSNFYLLDRPHRERVRLQAAFF